MKQLFIFFFLVLAFTACEETQVPEPEPPEELIPPSEVGAGFVSCLVNGEVWNVTNKNNIGSSLTNGGLIIRTGKRTETETQSLNFNVTNVIQLGTYSLDSQTGNGLANYNIQILLSDGITVARSYQTNTDYNGNLIITFLDTSQGIISGTFSFDAQRESTGEVIQILDGRFDIKL